MCPETYGWTLLTPTQTSLQQTTYENTKDILEVARDTDKATKDITEKTTDIAEKTTDIAEKAMDIVEKTTDIVRKTREIIVSVIRQASVVKAFMLLTGSCGPRNLGQTRSRA